MLKFALAISILIASSSTFGAVSRSCTLEMLIDSDLRSHITALITESGFSNLNEKDQKELAGHLRAAANELLKRTSMSEPLVLQAFQAARTVGAPRSSNVQIEPKLQSIGEGTVMPWQMVVYNKYFKTVKAKFFEVTQQGDRPIAYLTVATIELRPEYEGVSTSPNSVILPHPEAFNTRSEYENFKSLGEVLMKNQVIIQNRSSITLIFLSQTSDNQFGEKTTAKSRPVNERSFLEFLNRAITSPEVFLITKIVHAADLPIEAWNDE